MDYSDTYCAKRLRIASRGMITPAGGFRQCFPHLRLVSVVLLGRQRTERGLLLAAVSGYASVYNMNRYFKRGCEECGCLAQGALR